MSCSSGGLRRIVKHMERFFNIIRNTGFRRGPNRLVAGISGSIAQSLGVSVWLVRLLILLSFLLPVVGLALYLLVWALTPWQDGSIPLERFLDGQRDPQP
jgi:phage shock protein C